MPLWSVCVQYCTRVIRMTCWRGWEITSVAVVKDNVFHFNLGTWTKSRSTSLKHQLDRIRQRRYNEGQDIHIIQLLWFHL